MLQVLLQRLTWQRQPVWVLPPPGEESNKNVAALAWRPDGKGWYWWQMSVVESNWILQDVINVTSTINLYCSSRMDSSVASRICQEGQSERTFPILASFPRFFLFSPIFSSFSQFFFLFFLSSPDFFPIFDNFFTVKGGTLPPCPYTGYATENGYDVI